LKGAGVQVFTLRAREREEHERRGEDLREAHGGGC
jgi:hypothetical protein